MPPFENPFPASPRPRRKTRARAVLAAAALMVVALGALASPAGAQTYGSARPAPKPVQLHVFSPTAGATAGQNGAGFVVDLSLTARNRAANALLGADAGYKPFFNNPTSPTFKPGSDGGAPGLVVLLSTTPDTPGTPFHGPNTNLAGLFQTNGVGTVRHGLNQTWNTWQIGKAGFGSGPAMLTVFLVRGTAPDVVPASGLDVVSNTVHIPFTISAPAAAGVPATPANATVKTSHDPKLGDILVDANGRTVYMFEQDQGTTSACTGACAMAWPAFRPTGAMATGPGLDAAKLGNVNGQATYAGHLLYYYAGDARPGDTIGAAIPSWDAVSPTGAPVHAS